jgi:hypothetical protein
VKRVEPESSQAAFAPGTAHRAHHLGAGLPRGDEGGNHLRRVLEVRVHGHHRIGCGGMREPGGERALEAEVARQLDQLETRIVRHLRPDQLHGAIAAAIVHQDRPPDHLRIRIKQRTQPADELRQHGLLVEDRRHDRDLGSGI